MQLALVKRLDGIGYVVDLFESPPCDVDDQPLDWPGYELIEVASGEDVTVGWTHTAADGFQPPA